MKADSSGWSSCKTEVVESVLLLPRAEQKRIFTFPLEHCNEGDRRRDDKVATQREERKRTTVNECAKIHLCDSNTRLLRD